MLRLISKYDPTPWLLSDEETVNGVITGDWHIGDKYAPLPEQPATKEGGGIKPSKTQKKIKKELINQLKKCEPIDLLIMMGDCIEGKQLRSFGVPVSDADTDTQVNWAYQFYEETFYEYLKPKQVIVIMGTPYHVMVGIGGNLDYQFAEKISRLGETIFGYPNLQFYLGKEKLLWDLRHRISIARVNKLMPLEKTFRNFFEMAATKGQHIPKVIGRGHNHSISKTVTDMSTGIEPWYAFMSPTLKANDVYGQTLSYPDEPNLGFFTFKQDRDQLYGGACWIKLGERGVSKL